MAQTIKGEVIRNERPANNYDRAVKLSDILNDVLNLINEVHQMAGPARLELRDTTIIIKTPNGDRSAPIDFIIGDIRNACAVLEERLKG